MPNKTASKQKQATHYSLTTNHFSDLLKMLNPAQKKAVEALEGAVMVIAGPGTGKTQVTAMRTANILNKTQMRPGNILCLTFSTSGVKALRERLRTIIGPDAYGITIDTVHGFCNEIILTHPNIFETFNALEQVSDLEQLRIIKRILNNLKPGSVLGKPSDANPAYKTQVTSRASAILSRISEMKREGISVKDLRDLIPSYKDSINTTASGKERDKNSQVYKNDLRLTKQFEEFCDIYEKYNSELIENQRYDYNDMILFVIEALKTNEFLLSELQEKYQYILADEYQDLNGAQSEVVELITKEPTPDHVPNIFIVGDDDQAIYRFQGASIANMLEFTNRFPDAKVITLTENYRSTQEILDASMNVIGNNENRLAGKIDGIEKDLKAMSLPRRSQTRLTKTGAKPKFVRFPSAETELAAIAEILRKENEKGTDWNDMAVLCRRNGEANELFDVLTCAEIPVILTSKQDLILHPKIRELIVLLRAVESPDNDATLSAALGCEILEIHPMDLGKLWCSYRRQRTHNSLRSFILESEEFSVLNFPFSIIERLHAQKESKTLPEIIELALKDFGLIPRKDDDSADPRTIAVLHAFYDYVKIRSNEQKDMKLVQLLSDLEQYISEPGLKLAYDVPHMEEEGVQLMTAHAAKGMEFKFVLVPHVRYGNWGNRRQGSSFSLPENLIYGSERDEKNLKQEDERRLMYVAMTRAKDNLILTFAENYRSGANIKDAQVSSFMAEAGNLVAEELVDPKDAPKPIETLWKPVFKIDEAFEAFLRDQIKSFELSVTSLNAFLDDPKMFLWTHLLKMPQAKAPYLYFGSAIHHALEMRNRAWQKGEPFDMNNLLESFEESLAKAILTEKERAHYMHEGKELLEKYGSLTNEIPLILSTEKTIKGALTDKLSSTESVIPITGKIDRIDLFNVNGQKCKVIDYKTGRTRKTESAIRKEENLLRQLTFYKLLCDISPSFSHTASLFTFDFVGNPKEERSVIDVQISDEEVEELKELIQIVWKKITSLDFTEVG
ncbi:ATP-dependent helicase [Candidatus Peribacteria bacterium]|nr:ATP-dependent helicase [Candidatus Peribacteria bacterium]MBT4021339.1 ATP-dependent helicase [Candidatus Peribacteria bacterium]MBT4241200.1 ATP-dependent helicase [Candidatus Peribacteria bacterium]MBT4474225.1 ATP-dependent helicase [Candidatus Peribacteria bacterium]